MRTDTETLIEAMKILSRDIESGDGVANAAIAEAAERLGELVRERDEARSELAYRLEQCSIKQLQLSDTRKTILELQHKTL